jgi:integration host factor subunit alpha
MSAVTKSSLAKAIVYETGIPASIALNMLDSLIDIIITSTVSDGVVKIPKFGSFQVREKKTRMGVDLNTKKPALIAARKVVTFAPSSQLKQAVNASK